MKLVVQIPCYNEEKTLSLVVNSIPRRIKGIDEVKVLIVSDGSTDGTVEIAKKIGVDHIVDMPSHRGLAEAFRRGLEKSLEVGADIIVNTDGDNQYKGEDIPRLVEPILNRRAEIVIGCRDMSAIRHFSLLKKTLQRLGSWVVRKFSNTAIPDVTSGFRAYTRDAALRLNIFSNYTYTLETVIQAGRKEIPVSHIDIKANPKLRESRLIKSTTSYILRSIATILRIYLMYEPMKFFVKIGVIFLSGSAVLSVRYLYFFLFGARKGGHVQSLIFAIILTIIGAQLIFTGFLADIIAANRKLTEEILYRQRKEKLKV